MADISGGAVNEREAPGEQLEAAIAALPGNIPEETKTRLRDSNGLFSMVAISDFREGLEAKLQAIRCETCKKRIALDLDTILKHYTISKCFFT